MDGKAVAPVVAEVEAKENGGATSEESVTSSMETNKKPQPPSVDATTTVVKTEYFVKKNEFDVNEPEKQS